MRTLLLVLALGCAETNDGGGGGGGGGADCTEVARCEDGRVHQICEGAVRTWIQIGDDRFYCQEFDCYDVACDAQRECTPSVDDCIFGEE